MANPPGKFDPALRDRLQELQLYMENAVDQVTRAQRIVMGSHVGAAERDDDPLLQPINEALVGLVVLRNQVRERLMKVLSGSLKVIS